MDWLIALTVRKVRIIENVPGCRISPARIRAKASRISLYGFPLETLDPVVVHLLCAALRRRCFLRVHYVPDARKYHVVKPMLLVYQPLGDLDSDVCLPARKLRQLARIRHRF